MSEACSKSDVLEHSSAKKIKISAENENGTSDPQLKLNDFVLESILHINSRSKTVFVQGKFKGKPDIAVVLLEKEAFREDDLTDKGYFSKNSKLQLIFRNDIYNNFQCFPDPAINGLKTTIIYPATQKHIAKYKQQEQHLVLETPELYEKLTLPHITKEQFDLTWVYNILDGKSEQDRIVYDNKCEEEGFLLLPDLKWDGETRETLYFLGIIRKKNIKSLRDLDGSHVPLLKRIRDESKRVIFEKYQVIGSQIRFYVHYQPSFYYFHVHITYLKHEAPGIHVEKSHLLDAIIDNLEMMSDYYKKASLAFTMSEMSSLFNVYEAHNIVEKVKPKNINPTREELIDK